MIFSTSIWQVLSFSGHFRNWGKGRKPYLALRYGKRFFRLSGSVHALKIFLELSFPNTTSLHKALQLAKRSKLSLFFKENEAISWNLLILRDKNPEKVTLLSFKAMQKTVIWKERSDLESEVAEIKKFQNLGINTLGYEACNGVKNAMTQKIITPNFSLVHHYAEALHKLNTYLVKNSSLERVRYPLKLTKLSEILGPERWSKIVAKSYLETQLIPYVNVHGDFSPYNVLSEGAEVYVIDFERSFYANAWYDFVYAWVMDYITDFEFEKNLKLVAHATLKSPIHDTGILLDLAFSLFVLDNIYFIENRCRSALDARFTESLIERLKIKTMSRKFCFLIEESSV